MASNEDIKTTKVSVILDRPEHWHDWIFMRQYKATRHGLWDIVNPDAKEEDLEKLEKPAEVKATDFYTPQAGETGHAFTHMTTEEFSHYQFAVRLYQIELAEFKAKEKKLEDFDVDIIETVSRRHHHLLKDCTSTYARLKKLKQHLCPSTAEREQQLLARFQKLQQRPKREIDSWLDDWIHVTRLCEEAGLPDVTSPRVQHAFLLAVKSLDESWAAVQQTALFSAQRASKPVSTLEDLVTEFTMYWRTNKPVASSLGTFASVGVAQESEPETETDKSGN